MEKIPARNPDIVSRREEREALLFDPVDGNLLCINSTGIFVWDKCDGTKEMNDIAADVAEEFDVTSEKAAEDCGNFFKELEKTGFIGYVV